VSVGCREFETRFERWCAGTLDAEARSACEKHLAGCPSCSELAELARLPLPSLPQMDGDSPLNLLTGVLERTSGDVCARVEQSLAALVEGDAAARGDDLLVEHVEHCRSCSGLIAEMERLAVDLPRLAKIAPEPSLVDYVLRATLPISVRVRRWWTRTRPRWVGRPRFAAELSYALTLVLVVVFGTPVSPLQAMPQRALEIVQTERLESAERFSTWRSAAGRELRDGLGVVEGEIVERTQGLVTETKDTAGTILEEVASWFVNADSDTPANPNESTEETS